LSRAEAKPVKIGATLLAPIPGNSLSHRAVHNSDLCGFSHGLESGRCGSTSVEFPHSGKRREGLESADFVEKVG
jgi:hypothetical protein